MEARIDSDLCALEIVNALRDEYVDRLTDLELSTEAANFFREVVFVAANRGVAKGSAEVADRLNNIWAASPQEQRMAYVQQDRPFGWFDAETWMA